MLTRIFIAFVLLLLSFHSHCQQLKLADKQTGYFEQKKFLKILNRPFISKGEYTYTADQGLTWKTQFPINNTLVINRQGVFKLVAESELEAVTKEATASALMLSLFSADFDQLQKDFDIHFDNNVVQLTATNEAIQKVIHTIELTLFEQQIRAVKITEENGNRTEINLLPNDFITPKEEG